jgi:hypothetical protein
MSKRKKNIVVKLNVRPLWEIGNGHNSHISGSGQHDHQPKRLRTRAAIKRHAMSEGW